MGLVGFFVFGNNLHKKAVKINLIYTLIKKGSMVILLPFLIKKNAFIVLLKLQ
ncbi:hypothetical protein B0O44_102156 [Pedobacter nutrimenti]|jgi:hypothetical protein|uniref:Uncharacterized protein n=1 Tax=Pedobacter nutrimenti TaxID=1241337 RepID=A0A318UGL9_9SPHI|nr:hypothetical protein B0O44_102156 [Pedobacter nutrimenti]